MKIIMSVVFSLMTAASIAINAGPSRAAAPTFVGTGSVAEGGYNDVLTPGIPPGVQSGDKLVAGVYFRSTNGTFSISGGWSPVDTVDTVTANTGCYLRLWSRTAGSTNTAPTLTPAGGIADRNASLAFVTAFRNLQGFGVPGPIATNGVQQSTGPIEPPNSLDLPRTGGVWFIGMKNGTVWNNVPTLTGDGLNWLETIEHEHSIPGKGIGVVADVATWSNGAPALTGKSFTPAGGARAPACGKALTLLGTTSDLLSTGVSAYDRWDEQIIAAAAKHGHPDARFLKAQAWWESDQNFDVYSTSWDAPCGIPSGWSDAESRSFGLFQVTPACGEGVPQMMLASGRPNLTQNPADPLWPSSVFNPALNIDRGVHAIAEAVHDFKERFPSCPASTLVKMAGAAYVGNWEEINSCGDLGNADMIEYVGHVLRFYETHWGTYPDN